MTDDALTRLVQTHVGEGGRIRIREFAKQAIDPESGWSPSKSLVGNIVAGHQVKVTPGLLRAVAAGLGVPLRLVQVAAAEQYLGLVLDEGPASE